MSRLRYMSGVVYPNFSRHLFSKRTRTTYTRDALSKLSMTLGAVTRICVPLAVRLRALRAQAYTKLKTFSLVSQRVPKLWLGKPRDSRISLFTLRGSE